MTVTQAEIKAARRLAALSIVVNIALALGKGFVGVVSGSAALLADAVNSSTDVLASSALYVGLWVAGREHPAFPYGLYKAETIATLVTAMAILLAAYEIGKRAIFCDTVLPDTTLALPVGIVFLFVSLLFGLYQLRSGKRLNSPALLVDARDYLADSICTGVVVLGLVAARFGYAVDRYAAAVVSLFVFRAGGQLLLKAMRDLLDAAIDRDTEREIINMVESHPRISKVKQCLSRRAGGRFIIDLDVVMDTPSHKIADHVSDRLEDKIPEKFPRVVMARVRPHYAKAGVLRQLTPYSLPEGEVVDHLTAAPWFLLELIEQQGGKVVSREFIENPHTGLEKEQQSTVGRWLLSLKPDIVCLRRIEENPGLSQLENAGVEIRRIPEQCS